MIVARADRTAGRDESTFVVSLALHAEQEDGVVGCDQARARGRRAPLTSWNSIEQT